MAFACPNSLQFIPYNKAVPIATGNYTVSSAYTGYTQYIFTGPGTFSINSAPSSTVYALLVGGGGAGGTNGGGGGGGGAVNAVVATLYGGVTYRVYVGGGGIASAPNADAVYEPYNSSGQPTMIMPQASSTYAPYGNYYVWSPYNPPLTSTSSTWVMASAYFNAIQPLSTTAYNNYIDGGIVLAAPSSSVGMYYSTTYFSSSSQVPSGVQWIAPSDFVFASYPVVAIAMNRDSGQYSIVATTSSTPTNKVAYSVNYAYSYTTLTTFTATTAWTAATSSLGPVPIMYLCGTGTPIYSFRFSGTSAPTVSTLNGSSTTYSSLGIACNGSGTVVVWVTSTVVYLYSPVQATISPFTTPLTYTPDARYTPLTGCAMSADGTRLTVTTAPGYVLTATSYNNGYTWTWTTPSTTVFSGTLTGISASLDGSVLAVCSLTGSAPYVSTDYGSSWRVQSSFLNGMSAYTSGITVSPYGSELLVAAYTGTSGYTGYLYQASVYPTTYTGYSLTTITSTPGYTGTSMVSGVYYNSSYTGTTDGNVLTVTTLQPKAPVYTSTSAGVVGYTGSSLLTTYYHTRVAASPDGQYVIATYGFTGSTSATFTVAGYPYYSSNWGSSYSTLTFALGSTAIYTSVAVNMTGNFYVALAQLGSGWLLAWQYLGPSSLGFYTAITSIGACNFITCSSVGTIGAYTANGAASTSYPIYTFYASSFSTSSPYFTFTVTSQSTITSTTWAGIVMSADGSRLYAISIPSSVSSVITPILYRGYCSDGNGVFWRWTSSTLAATTGTYSAASFLIPPCLHASGDCRVLAYMIYNVAVYLSTDFGITFYPLTFTTGLPISLTVSPNGNIVYVGLQNNGTFILTRYSTSNQYALLSYGGGRGGSRDYGYSVGGFGFGSGGGAGAVYSNASIASAYSYGGSSGYNVGTYGGASTNVTYFGGGGGGGAGGTGASCIVNQIAGNGGTGAAWWLNSTFYGGGGGGGVVLATSGYTPGVGTYRWGGGGTGGVGSSSSTIYYGGAGLANTGGGGGGGSGSNSFNPSGNGGSGITILALRNT